MHGFKGLPVIDPELVPMVAARFKVLAEPARLTILSALQGGEKSVGELVAASGRSQPNVSQHLASLLKAGLVSCRREGTRVLYSNADPYVLKICEAVCSSLTARARAEAERMGALPQTTRRRKKEDTRD
jgi:DNA-binding transcriptional ArsR family regulator